MKDNLNIDQQLCFPIYVFAKQIINRYRPFLEAIGLTYPQYLVMMVLWDKKEQTVNQLGDKLKLDSGTLTPLLKRMEQKEFLTRLRSKTDERVVNIAITEKGEALKAQAKCIPEQLMESMAITEEDLISLKKIITKIIN